MGEVNFLHFIETDVDLTTGKCIARLKKSPTTDLVVASAHGDTQAEALLNLALFLFLKESAPIPGQNATARVPYLNVRENLATALPAASKVVENEVVSSANARQVGGDHYRISGETFQHWDYVAQRRFDYFQGVITKYVERWKFKNGLQDLEKALHYLEKYIEVHTQFLPKK